MLFVGRIKALEETKRGIVIALPIHSIPILKTLLIHRLFQDSDLSFQIISVTSILWT